MLTKSEEEKQLLEIIEKRDINTVFQPIINLKNGSLLGYEALSRGPKDSIYENPLKLFEDARKNNLLFSLERVARESAIYNARDIGEGLKLFINVDPYIIYDKHFKSGYTRKLLKESSLSEKNIIFEITEKTNIEDFDLFNKVIAHYRQQGYKIAIDDTGAGYSGLQSIISVLFDYIKIDRALITDINKDPVKQALLESLVSFAKRINSRIIAEGIESIDELNTLIEIGVDYGQGFIIAKPDRIFKKDLLIREYIIERNYKACFNYNKTKIADITCLNSTVNINTVTEKVVNIFENNNMIQSLVVVDNNKVPVGIVMRDKLYYKLGSKFGYAVYMERPIELIMDSNPMIINYNLSINEVSQKAMKRNYLNIYDSIIVEKDGKYYGSVSIKDLLEEVSKMRIEEAKQLNPLTRLPGNRVIEFEINKRLEKKDLFSVLYIDLDNFKAYNDCYGYMMGDKVLMMTARLLKESIKNLGNEDDFIGHIGGDDFVIITTTAKDYDISNYLINNFDKYIINYINNTDFNRSCFLCVDRQGNLNKIPITSISIAIVSNEISPFSNHLQISDMAADIKKKAKNIEGSVCVKNKRQWA
ncbi:MAG: EAL domain-containing protein [Halanaerobiaceae bacterium]